MKTWILIFSLILLGGIMGGCQANDAMQKKPYYPSPIIEFSRNLQIYYHGRQPASEKNTSYGGSLKERWFYHVQTYE